MTGVSGSIKGLFSKGGDQTSEYPLADVYRGLRQRVITLDPATIGLTPSEVNRVWGVLVEMGLAQGVASLVTLADGTVSMYFSSGGGFVGGGQREGLRAAGKAFLAIAPGFLQYAQPTSDFPLPKKGQVRFHFLTYDSAFTAEARQEDLVKDGSELSPLFREANQVIAQVRLAQETSKEAKAGDPTVFQRLMHAAATGDSGELRMLLERGIDPNTANAKGITPLMVAAHVGKENVLRLLLESGSAIDAKDASGQTALMFACNAGHSSCVQTLVEHGAGVNERSNDDSTPIMFAAQHGHNDVVRFLLANGADPTCKGKHGLSAIGLAEHNGLAETLRILTAKE